MTAAEMLQKVRAGFSAEGPFESDLDAERAADAFATTIEPVAADDFVCIMDGGALTTEYQGLEGLRKGWMDFLKAFDSIAIRPGEIHESPDGRCVAEFVELTGKPKGAAGEIEQAGGAVWRVWDDRLQSVEFHIDRDRALRSAGIEL